MFCAKETYLLLLKIQKIVDFDVLCIFGQCSSYGETMLLICTTLSFFINY